MAAAAASSSATFQLRSTKQPYPRHRLCVVTPKACSTSHHQSQQQQQQRRRNFLANTVFLSALTVSMSPMLAKAENFLSDWERVYLPIDPDVVLLDIAFVPDDPSHGFLLGTRQTILETKDGGKTWNPRAMQLAAEEEDFNSISFKGKEGWIVGKPAILLYTADTGETWKRIPPSSQLPGDMVYINATDDKSAETVTVTDEGEVYNTSNGGYNWKASVQATVSATLNRTVSSGIGSASYYTGTFNNVNHSQEGQYVAVSSRENFYSTWEPSQSLQSPPTSLTDTNADNAARRDNLEDFLVRRPVIQPDTQVNDTTSSSIPSKSNDDKEEEDEEKEDEKKEDKSALDRGLEKLAKKLPMFEPGESGVVKDKPLKINLDLALYRAKILTRNFQYSQAKELLQQCIYYWPEDGRPYVALGKVLRKQSKVSEARSVYEKGSQATQGENPFIWQCWAVLENELGNVRKARELFDAATVADKRHIAAWHGWAVLELKQGNIQKARNLLGKGIKYCGGNEYVYQTLALLEAKANRYEQARYLFRQATKCNPKSCASWLAWAQLEVQQENNRAARSLFEKAVQASPKNRFAWHVWGVFEASLGRIDKGRKLLKIGHLVNPRDPVLLQSLALLEFKHSTANVSRVLFKRASELDPRHQPVWIAWGWMEWKEGNLSTARELYQKALTVDATSESAARCLQAWGVLEQRVGNLSAARRLFRSSLNINSQSYVTWMTWANLEEDQGNSTRAEEIRDLYFQQRTEVVDDPSWVMGLLDILDPALDSIKKLLNFEQDPYKKSQSVVAESKDDDMSPSPTEVEDETTGSGFNLDAFVQENLSLDTSDLDAQMETSLTTIAESNQDQKKVSKTWLRAK